MGTALPASLTSPNTDEDPRETPWREKLQDSLEWINPMQGMFAASKERLKAKREEQAALREVPLQDVDPGAPGPPRSRLEDLYNKHTMSTLAKSRRAHVRKRFQDAARKVLAGQYYTTEALPPSPPTVVHPVSQHQHRQDSFNSSHSNTTASTVTTPRGLGRSKSTSSLNINSSGTSAAGVASSAPWLQRKPSASSLQKQGSNASLTGHSKRGAVTHDDLGFGYQFDGPADSAFAPPKRSGSKSDVAAATPGPAGNQSQPYQQLPGQDPWWHRRKPIEKPTGLRGHLARSMSARSFTTDRS